MKFFATVTVALAVLARVSAQETPNPTSTDEAIAGSSTGTSPATGIAASGKQTGTASSSAAVSTGTSPAVAGGSKSNSTLTNPLAGVNISAVAINPALSQACKDSVLPQATTLLDPCGLTPIVSDLAVLGASNKTVTQEDAAKVLDKIFNANVLNGFCSEACTTAITTAGQAIATACGNTPLIVSNNTVASPLSPALALTAGDVAPLINFVRQGACVKEAGAFCVANQWTQIKPVIANNATLTDAQANAFVCSPCVKKESDAWSAATGLPAALKTPVSDALTELKKVLSACPADSLVSKDTKPAGSGAQIASGAAAALAGAIGLAGALIVG